MAEPSSGDQISAQETSAPNPDLASQSAEPRATQEAVTRIATLEEEISTLRAELSSVNDKYLRKLADEVNFRKRMVREKEDGQRFAVASLLGDLIPVLDDFERAIASSEVAKDYIVLHDGIGLIRRQLAQVLENKYGLKKLDSRGQPFDPNFHEAVAVVQGALGSGSEAIVDEEFLPAYCLNERILRTAKVRVRMPMSQGSQDGSAKHAGETGTG
ncbi:MAG: nucleotide exchange factor GrpE [Bacillota bacterium]|nr:nucleotide exchange factor GrpE [Bacillota bacterium]